MTLDPNLQVVYDKLKSLRERTDLSLRPTKHLKTTFTAFNGEEKPLRVRYYQVQGILHLLFMHRFVLGDDTGLGKCCTGDTLLWTDRGLLPISALAPKPLNQLVPGTFYDAAFPVKVWTGSKWAAVKRFYYDGLRATKKVKTRSGFTVEGSHRHPLKIRGPKGEGWRRLPDVQKGEFLLVDRQASAWPEDPAIEFTRVFAANAKTYIVPQRMTPEFARLLGYIVAEGHSPDQYTVGVTQHDPEAHADIRSLFKEVFGWEGNHNSAKRNQQVDVTSIQIRSFLETCGIGPELSAHKRVPPLIMQAGKTSVVGFLQGFFEGEGHVLPDSGVEISSASRRLLHEVHLLLLRLGIVSVLRPKKVKGREHTYWRLTFFGDDARLFQREVGFVTLRKRKALEGVLEKAGNPNHDVVPHAREMVGVLRAEIYALCGRHGFKGGGISKRWGTAFYNTLGQIRAGRRNPTYAFLNRLLQVATEVGIPGDHPAMCAVQGVCTQHAFYDPVVSIEDGFAEVMDIEVDDPDHCFVGNGLMNHNTLETIAALCYVWEKEPDRKVIIMTTKSATIQWVKEFSKFTTGVTVLTCKGTKAQRQKAYQMYEDAEGPTVLVMGYRSAVQDISQLQHWEDFIVVYDECFQYHTPVTLADGTTELIGKIVSQQMSVEVLSQNPVTGEIEPRRVVAWHRVPLHKGPRKNLLKVTPRFGGKVRVTRSHEFLTPCGGEVLARNLRKGTEITHLCPQIPSEDQWQVILGGLLGDSSISHPKRSRWGVAFGHCKKQEQYLRFKHDVLSTLGVSNVEESPNRGYPLKGGATKLHYRFRLGANDAVTSFLVQARIRRGNKKRVTSDWLDHIGSVGLAIWYADDGSLSTHLCKDGLTTHKILLNVQGFSWEEVELLAGWLRWKWGVEAEVRTTKPRTGREEGCQKAYPYLYLGTKAAKKFLGILPFGFPGVEYKFPGKRIACPADLDMAPKPGTIKDWVTDVKVWEPTTFQKDKYVYDIEVEGNHNYFANSTLVSNCTAFKNPKTQVHQVCKHMASQADRAWGLTATLIKNHLMEGYGIYQVIMPGLFESDGKPMSLNQFMLYYCLVRMQSVGRGRQIPVVVGYLPEKIREFREVIDPYFIGRPKHEVATELPALTTRIVDVPMSEEQEDKYAEAIHGLLELGDGDIKEVSKLTAVTYCQQIVNDLELIGIETKSPKLDELVDLLTEGDFSDQNIIVFTRFRKMVDIIMPVLKTKKVYAVRITGAESMEDRAEAMANFQNPDHPARVAVITTAGADAINLQAAKALICYDTPWSAGDFLQLVGRMIRIGSEHDRCYVIHLTVSSKRRSKTIDRRIMEVLGKKMKLVEAVLGKRLKGDMDDMGPISVENDISDLFDALVSDAQEDMRKL